MGSDILSNRFESCLLKVPIFNHLKVEDQENIMQLTSAKRLKKGETLYNMGDYKDHLYVLHRGSVKVSKYNEDGQEQVFRVLKPGDFIGEEALFNDRLSNESIIALEDSHICVLRGTDFREYIYKKPEIAIEVIKELTNRLKDAESKLEQVNLETVEQRVVKALIEYSGGNHVFRLPSSKADFASMLGMSSETLSRKLRELKELEIIDLKGHREIIIKDFDELNYLK